MSLEQLSAMVHCPTPPPPCLPRFLSYGMASHLRITPNDVCLWCCR